MASLRQLEYLVTIVEEGSFTRAAELLHVSQPALSHQVRALEREVGGPLLERLPRAVRLTAMGRAMLPHARAALADAERARCAARQAGGLETGELQVATLYSVSLGVLPPALRAWRRSHPGVRVRLFEHSHAEQLREAMVAGQADLAIGPAPRDWDGPVTPLGTEPFLVVLPADDPAGRPGDGADGVRGADSTHGAHGPDGADASDGAQTVDLTALADRDWVHFAPGNGLGEILDQACAAAGFQPRAAVRTEQTAAAPVLAAAGLGPTLVPANVIPPHFDGRVLWPRPPVERLMTAYTRGRPDPLAAAFIATLGHAACLVPAHVRALR
ncbi:LysR family transcriptional regulator [Microbispora sp. ZYX-F-249]|uniref:LysR family transcriptional regulator n=1 Tax=Microbispora maris TaxID=3144104 RepID=A0ABV0AJZ1_9ACTN